MAGLEGAQKPEQKVDIEEEEDVGEKKRVLIAPCPERRDRACFCGGVVAEEREIEENGRKRSEECYHRVPEVLAVSVATQRRHSDHD